MKTKFPWYYRATDQEIGKIWQTGILTVDANVLLDLYRYHESTRNSLIASLEKFEGAKWLSYQACQEFFRNRTKVIVSSEKTFKQANEEVEKLRLTLESTVSQLKGNRIIPVAIADSIAEAVSGSVDQAKRSIQDATEKYPNFLTNDPVLFRLSEIFSASVGDDFKVQDLDDIKKQAEERKTNKVPPGYLDEDKDGDRPYGDYFLWRQILDHAKAAQKPIVFVTSERKEDWWEKISGRTTGPRPELLREAYEQTGQKILIYQTDLFLEYALKRFEQAVDEKAVEEIRAVDTLRRYEFEPAVKVVSQTTNANTLWMNSGMLTLELRRPVKNFTGSGHFNPEMAEVPNVSAKLVQSPLGIPPVKVTVGTGTTYDFNVHIRSIENGLLLSVGQYTFEYEASCTSDPVEVPPERTSGSSMAR